MNGNRQLRVLQVVDTLGMGGAETWLMELLRLWSKTGVVQMDFLLTSGNPGIFDEEARRLGAGLHYATFRQSSIAQFARRFRQILRGGCYDVIHDHQDYASGWHFLMGFGVLPRLRVTHVHNPWLHMEANYAVGLRRKLAAIAGKDLVKILATHVCGTSREVLNKYSFEVGQHRGPEVSVVHCGIAIDKFNANVEYDRQTVRREFGWAPDVKIVLFVGRLDRAFEFDHPQNHKNSWFALNVARVALRTEPRLRLLMAGAGEHERQELERRIAEWGLQGKLNLIGIRRDIPRLMRAADVLLFPSQQEGLGMAAVEAQSVGLRVLASTAVPREAIVIPELVHFLPLSEPVTRWSEMLLDIMSPPRDPAEIYRSAMEVSDFSIANSARKLLRVYGGTGASEGRVA